MKRLKFLFYILILVVATALLSFGLIYAFQYLINDDVNITFKSSLNNRNDTLNTSYYINNDGNLVSDNLFDINNINFSNQNVDYVIQNNSLIITNSSSSIGRVYFSLNTSNYLSFSFVSDSSDGLFAIFSLSLESNYVVGLNKIENINYSNNIISFYVNANSVVTLSNIMINSGSTALDYEYYGIWYSQDNYNTYGFEQYNNGYGVGYQDGYDEANDTIDTSSASYQNGYSTGYEDGQYDGYNSGYEVGYDTGYDLGYTNGKLTNTIGNYFELASSQILTYDNTTIYTSNTLNDSVINSISYVNTAIGYDVEGQSITNYQILLPNYINVRPDFIFNSVLYGYDYIIEFYNGNNLVFSIDTTLTNLLSDNNYSSYYIFDNYFTFNSLVINNSGTDFMEDSPLINLVASASAYQVSESYTSGYNTGYDNGYNTAISNNSNAINNYDSLKVAYDNLVATSEDDLDTLAYSMISSVLSTPVNLLHDYLNFNFFGINIFGIFTSLITILLLVWLIKFFLGRK